MKQIETKQLESVRGQLIKKQGGVCAICGRKFTRRDDAVVDHDHNTGVIRGAIHRSCNMAEGKVKARARAHRGVKSYDYLIYLGKYLEHHSTPRYGLIHPSHMTPEKKRIERNRKAKIARDAKKLMKAVKQ